jgi:threonine dehydrogenase-like Zn-dependent dehydrogenase
MKAIVKQKNNIALKLIATPKLLDTRSVLIKVAIAGLCRTDLYAAQGKMTTKESVILGHEFSGTVEKVGEDVKHIKIGDRVGIMPILKSPSGYRMLGIEEDGAFADYVLIPADLAYLVPEQISFQEAAFLEPIAAALAVLKTPIKPEHKGLIYGDNRIAELTSRILSIYGFTNIELCDEQNDQLLIDNSYDFIIETTPTEKALDTIARCVKPKGLIVLKSRPFHSVPLLFKTIVQKEIQLVGAHYGDFQLGIDLLANNKLYVKDLFGSIYSFEEAIPILTGKMELAENKKIFFQP